MENFNIYNPVRVHFGKGVLDQLGEVVAGLGSRVLFLYGKGSVHKNGVYDLVKEQLSGHGAEVWEYHGIKSNPLIEDVDAAAEVARVHQAEVILAVGGGSVIDTAKIVAAAVPAGVPGWDLVTRKIKPSSALPVVAVLTLAATGTEMNSFAVVQNESLGVKTSFGSPYVFPAHSFLDPTFTCSVPAQQTGYGIVDLMSHALEAWFGKGDSPLADRIVLSILKEAMEAGPLLMENLNDYNLRARVMCAATLALNGTTTYGRAYGDWGVHAVGHVLSLMYDVPHGASLSVTYPAWLRWMAGKNPERVGALMHKLFYSDDIEDGIYKLEYFFGLMHCPVRLHEIGIYEEHFNGLLAHMKKSKVSGRHHLLKNEDLDTLLQFMK